MTKPNEFQISGKVTIPTAGGVEQLGTVAVDGPVLIKVESAGPGVQIGNNGLNTVGPDSGFMLPFGEWLSLEYVANLARIYVYAHAANTTVCWMARRVGG